MAVLVKVKVAVPAPAPVTTPAFVTVATSVLLLTQVPPLSGVTEVVAPTQMGVVPKVAGGKAFTVKVEVVA